VYPSGVHNFTVSQFIAVMVKHEKVKLTNFGLIYKIGVNCRDFKITSFTEKLFTKKNPRTPRFAISSRSEGVCGSL
jgi:hypothetical protein